MRFVFRNIVNWKSVFWCEIHISISARPGLLPTVTFPITIIAIMENWRFQSIAGITPILRVTAATIWVLSRALLLVHLLLPIRSLRIWLKSVGARDMIVKMVFSSPTNWLIAYRLHLCRVSLNQISLNFEFLFLKIKLFKMRRKNSSNGSKYSNFQIIICKLPIEKFLPNYLIQIYFS